MCLARGARLTKSTPSTNDDKPVSNLDISIKYRFIRRESRTQRRRSQNRIRIRRQQSQISRIKDYILLERPVLMVQMIRRFPTLKSLTILLPSRKTALAPPTNPRREPDPD